MEHRPLGRTGMQVSPLCLGTMMLHRPQPDTDVEETLGALTDLQRAGKIRAFGCSTFPAEEIVEAPGSTRAERIPARYDLSRPENERAPPPDRF